MLIYYPVHHQASLVALLVMNLPAKNPLEESMAIHPSILDWRIPWTEKSGGLWSIGLQRVVHDWNNLAQSSSYHLKMSPRARPLGSHVRFQKQQWGQQYMTSVFQAYGIIQPRDSIVLYLSLFRGVDVIWKFPYYITQLLNPLPRATTFLLSPFYTQTFPSLEETIGPDTVLVRIVCRSTSPARPSLSVITVIFVCIIRVT